ncbi:signal peptide peptidase SppA [Magnetococcus sp. PR-3]|uniref:signal peptide peptidase SppA n=1 Tax=Magnetococcus sp. PR-3 TaxID=3120355 RepID=UPI002FCE124B
MSDWHEPSLEDKAEPPKPAVSESETQLRRVLSAMEESRFAERTMLESLVKEGMTEQKKQRRGKNLFRLFIALYLIATMVLLNADGFEESSASLGDEPHVAVVTLAGAIMPESEVDAETVMKTLREAFEDKNTKAVILRINSPGGSPVQAGMIFDEIKRLRAKYKEIKLYAALEDLCASGGYYVAAAADEIYADKATLVGSIGVIMKGFGLEKLAENVGLENRTLTAGSHKAFLDPLAPVDDQEKAHAQGLLNQIHKQFIQVVKKGRGDRLKADDQALFNGLIWTGEEALELGLVDGLGSVEWLAREKIKITDLMEFERDQDWSDRFFKELSSGTASMLMQVQQRAPYMGM